jgi:hypothetical protein
MTHSHNQRKKEPMPEQAEEQAQKLININMTPNSLVISTVVAAIDENMMHQIVVKWLETHPALLAEIAKQAAAAKQNELQIIRHVKTTRND